MELKNKTISVQLEDTFNGFDLTYSYQVDDGTLMNGVSVTATKDGRQIAHKFTQDGIDFTGSVNDHDGDDLNGLNHEMNTSLKVLLKDWGTYV